MEKIAVIYHRLIENAYLDLTVKRTLYQYLKNHTIGFGANDNEAFDLIVQSHRNDLIYFEKICRGRLHNGREPGTAYRMWKKSRSRNESIYLVQSGGSGKSAGGFI